MIIPVLFGVFMLVALLTFAWNFPREGVIVIGFMLIVSAVVVWAIGVKYGEMPGDWPVPERSARD